MVGKVFRGIGAVLLICILLATIWLAIGLFRPLDPIPMFGQSHPRSAITNVTIIDVAAGIQLPGQTVRIENGRITAISATSSTPLTANTQQIDGTGKYLLPGLWDAHVHTLAHSPRIHFPLLLASGITTIRNLGDGCSWDSDATCVPDQVDWNAQGAHAQQLVRMWPFRPAIISKRWTILPPQFAPLAR